MLNLYLAPRGGGPLEPDRVEAALTFLAAEGIVGDADPTCAEHAPGAGVQNLFNDEAHEVLLPAELTFDSLRVVHSGAPRFLPEAVESFDEARCQLCGDHLDADALADDLDRLLVFAVDRFEHICPACRSPLTMRDIDFGQPTTIARDWLFLEGVGTSRLSGRLIEQLGRVLGVGLVAIPEVLEDDFDGPGEAFAGRTFDAGARRRRDRREASARRRGR